MNKRILYAGIISLALAMIFSACPPPPDPAPDPDPTSVPDPTIYTVTVTDENLDQMKSLIAEAAAAGGGTRSTNPIVVTITISDASLLSRTNSDGTDSLHKLFDAIPNAKYVSYDLSGSTFTSLGDTMYYTTAGFFRPNKDYLASITLPETLTSIGESAFEDCSKLTSITIPDSVTSIGNYAFYDCSGLTSITIPDSVTSIGKQAFSDCSGLTLVSIGNNVTSIDYGVFYGCSSLTSIEVNEGNASYKDIDGVVFNKAGTELVIYPRGKGATYTIPNGVTSIGSVFDGCSKLTSITLPETLTSIGNGAFGDCSKLTSITIPDSVTSIGTFVFSGCSSLTSIEVNASNPSYTSIDGVLFDKAGETLVQCPPGKEGTYTIPNGVTSIGDRAFWGCDGLTEITIPTSVTSIGEGAFVNCSNLTSVSIPDSVTSIGESAFWGCSGLTSITIPNSVTSIGESAFWGCSGLTSITIPNSVESIGYEAFCQCTNLTRVDVLRNTPPTLETDVFNGTHASLEIYVPAGTVDAYEAADGWSSYTGKIQAVP